MTEKPPNEPMLPSASSTQMAALAHVSALLALFVGLPPLGPLLVWIFKKDSDAYVARESLEALNFNLSWFLYFVVGAIAAAIGSIILIGLLLVPVLIVQIVAWFILVLMGTTRASGGQGYRYPLTIRFIQ